MPKPIDFYFDFLSPYAYFAATKIETLAARFDRRVSWHAFLLGVTVMQVMGLKPIMETPLKADYAEIDRPRMAKLLGLPLTVPDLTGVNSVTASRAFYWLNDLDEDLAKEFARMIFRRLWVEGRDITGTQDVIDSAVKLDIDCAKLNEALAGAALKQRLRDEVASAIAQKVFGSPFFIVDEQPIWGVDRLWMLEHWLTHGSWDQVQEDDAKKLSQ